METATKSRDARKLIAESLERHGDRLQRIIAARRHLEGMTAEQRSRYPSLVLHLQREAAEADRVIASLDCLQGIAQRNGFLRGNPRAPRHFAGVNQ